MIATLPSPTTSTTAPDVDASTIPPWSRPPDDVVVAVSSDPRAGLSQSEVATRLERDGPNRLETRGPRSILRILIDQFRGPVVAILAAAALVSMMLAHWLEAGAIGLVLAIDAAIGFTAEWRAIRSMESLRALGRTQVRVRRDGRDLLVDDESLVVGDIVIVEAGDIVAADARVLEANKLEADESMLTGESEPVAKSIDPVSAPTPAADRTCMLHRGTTVLRGSGLAV
ncbi:MAG: hypothetical protein RLZZ461_1474, partial [Planctomycetota bacterium]